MSLTQSQIRRAAAASRDARGGSQILVYADGTLSEACSDNDNVCLLGSDGSREYPLLRLRAPVSARRLTEMVDEMEWLRSREVES